jgi:formylmethanofuran dehydrogenase subunit E-like metal-binding protein
MWWPYEEVTPFACKIAISHLLGCSAKKKDLVKSRRIDVDMNVAIKLIALALLMAMLPGIVFAQNSIMEVLGTKVAKMAMEQLKFEKGDANVLALTDSGHAIVDGQTTQAALKGLTQESGNSIGDGNLFQILRPHWKPLWFYFFNKATGEAVYMEADSSALKPEQEFRGVQGSSQR